MATTTMNTFLALLCSCLVATTLSFSLRHHHNRHHQQRDSETTSIREKIAMEAMSRQGSKLWSFASAHKTGAHTNKRSIFVAEAITAAGGQVPYRHRRWSPIGAREWANPHSHYVIQTGCWARVYTSFRGDVVALNNHVAIVTGPRTTTSASKYVVVSNNWGFRPGQFPTIWRYIC